LISQLAWLSVHSEKRNFNEGERGVLGLKRVRGPASPNRRDLKSFVFGGENNEHHEHKSGCNRID